MMIYICLIKKEIYLAVWQYLQPLFFLPIVPRKVAANLIALPEYQNILKILNFDCMQLLLGF